MHRALIFDSGVGGLSVVAHIRALMPNLSLFYAADEAYLPYGNKTPAQLVARLPGLLHTLELATKPDTIVIACNTASTVALPSVRAACDVPIIGVVPAIKPAAEQSKSRSIAVLGTLGTVRRRYVDDLITRYAGNCRVTLHGSIGLVDLAERKLAGEQISLDDVSVEIAPVFKDKVDTVVLACTHFPLLQDELREAAPYKVDWIDSGAAVARQTKSVLSAIPSAQNVALQTVFSTGTEISTGHMRAFRLLGFEKFVALGG